MLICVAGRCLFWNFVDDDDDYYYEDSDYDVYMIYVCMMYTCIYDVYVIYDDPQVFFSA